MNSPMPMLELSSHRVTDDDGLPLRTSHFPFNLERKSPPKSAGFGLKPVNPPEKKVIGKSVRTLSSSASLQPTPTTYMMVDYQQDRKAITAKLLVETMRKDRVLPASLATGIPSAARSPRIRRSPNRPPQPLRSSFLLRSQPSVIGKGANELNLPSSLMYQKDEAIQTAAELERLDLNISAYQSWSNKTVEPFLKDLRKSIKASRPASLEDYIIAYCLAKQRNEPPPETKGGGGSGGGSAVADPLDES